MLNKVQIASVSVSVSVSAETENVFLAAVSVTAVTGKSGFGRSLLRMKVIIKHICHILLFVVIVKDAINRPMLRTSNKIVKKAAVEVFKQIQIYMGDRLARSSPTQAALEVVSRGWSIAELRDEIFVQLCRQTNNNPKP